MRSFGDGFCIGLFIGAISVLWLSAVVMMQLPRHENTRAKLCVLFLSVLLTGPGTAMLPVVPFTRHLWLGWLVSMVLLNICGIYK